MSQNPSTQLAAQAVDEAAQALSHAQASAQALAQETKDSLSDAVHTLIHDVSPVLVRLGEQLAALSRQGVHAVQAGTHRVSEKAHDATDCTVGYIRKEPVKSVLLAAGVGALLVTVVSAMSHRPGGTP